jgi:hypothetical protein
MTDACGRRQWLLGSVTAMIMASHRSQPQERAKGWLLNSLQPSMSRNADSSVGY